MSEDTSCNPHPFANGVSREVRDYIDGQVAILEQRLAGMDKATEVLSETVTRTPTEIQKEVAHLRELDEEKFRSVQTQFLERDERSARESRDNKIAVDAAFAAQKEAAATSESSNQKAIDKSERATADVIAGQGSKVDDLKERLTAAEARLVAIEANKLGQQETRVTVRDDKQTAGQSTGLYIAGAAVALSLAGVIIALISHIS
jgi:uncharacterized coiled-coil protein SlyX